jgi:transcription-repair coupling factor (superfamily II helicase)
MERLRRIFEDILSRGELRRVAERLERGSPLVSVSGPSGAARALTITAGLLAENRSAAVLTNSSSEARTLAAELRYFFSLLSPNPPRVIHMPSLEVDPYRGLSPHPDISAERARGLWHLLRDDPFVCVVSARAAALRLVPPQRFLSTCMELRQDDDCSPEKLRALLMESGYIEDDPVTDPGEFSLRGGIVDVFSPHLENPVRLDFFGDRLESLRTFNVDTQRSLERIDATAIIPMREYSVTPAMLERWSEEILNHWDQSFHSYLEEELSLASQRETFPAFEFHLPLVDPLSMTLFDYLGHCRLVSCDREPTEISLERYLEELFQRYVDRVEAHKPVLAPENIYLNVEEFRRRVDSLPRMEIEQLSVERTEAAPLHISCQSIRKYHGNMRDLVSDIGTHQEAGEKIVFLFSTLGRVERLHEILRDYEIESSVCLDEEGHDSSAGETPGSIFLGTGPLQSGFYLPTAKLRVLTGSDVFDEADIGAAPRRTKSAQRKLFLSDFKDLKPGDYVVHVDHGIGQFGGLKNIGVQGDSREFMLLSFQGEAKLYVPVERLDLVQKYSSVGGTRPSLDRLGGTSWVKTKSRIKKSMRDMAEELLKLYAERKMAEGFSFDRETTWQREFEDAFEFDLTQDQIDALDAVKHDMEANRPMDRLLCGDVGYGKTEVAMRASFKAVMDGKQVAFLAPTTVLAFQHYNTFRQRFTAFPVNIELLSRFRSQREQKRVVERLEEGSADIVIGTHRLLSKDVSFKDLGLVIVDEEQRFGVAHKERLKALKTRVDVLTLSATPIPRTLHMALMDLRDMSTIETPPKNRLAIQTSVIRFNHDVIRSSIEQEMARNGQVYFVHNRVETITTAASMVQRLVPMARIGVAHGQMSERELEKVMMNFVRNELDVLVATTIIENGLDIPRVNTIIINRADLYGMSQLYQLRGRVGRSDRRAYAYLLIPSEEVLSDVARKRLAAIREFSDLGMGFRIAALDLEIRGAGNLLGGEQHGHINAVGFDLYCQLLEHAVEELRGQKPAEEVATSINLNLDIRIPEDYIQDQSQRLRMYKRISSATEHSELDELRQEMIDRFGRYPDPVENLFRYSGLRQLALALQIQSIEKNKNQIFFRFVDESRVSPQKLLSLVSRSEGASLSPQGILTLETSETKPSELFPAIHQILEHIQD